MDGVRTTCIEHIDDTFTEVRSMFDDLETAKEYISGLDPESYSRCRIDTIIDDVVHEVYVADRGDDLETAHLPTDIELEESGVAVVFTFPVGPEPQ